MGLLHKSTGYEEEEEGAAVRTGAMQEVSTPQPRLFLLATLPAEKPRNCFLVPISPFWKRAVQRLESLNPASKLFSRRQLVGSVWTIAHIYTSHR